MDVRKICTMYKKCRPCTISPICSVSLVEVLVDCSMFEERRPHANKQRTLASKQLTHVFNLFGLSVAEAVVAVGCDSDLLKRSLEPIQLVGVI